VHRIRSGHSPRRRHDLRFPNVLRAVHEIQYVTTNTTFARFVGQRATGPHIVLAVFLILLQPFFASLPTTTKVFELFRPALVAFIFFGSLRGESFIDRVLSQIWLVKIGTISYSLFLWQQIFLSKPDYGAVPILNNPLFIVPCALLSCALIERPMMRIGHNLSARIIERSKPVFVRCVSGSEQRGRTLT
jgi:peptidoglycan/LPS O-acetylase OafA/YrhL